MDFSDIVERSRALRSLHAASSSTFPDHIPHLERGLPQIDVESRRLTTSSQQQQHRHSHHEQVSNAQALSLLSEYGYETDKIERTLQSVALMDAFQPVQPMIDTDLQSYMDSNNELIVAAAIDQTLRQSKIKAVSSLASVIDAEWEVAKRDLLSIPQGHNQNNPHLANARLNTPTASRRASNRYSFSQQLKSSTQPGLMNQTSAITPQAFASPFRQPRSSRTSGAHDAHNAVSMFRSDGTHASLSSMSSVSIYHDIVRRLVYENYHHHHHNNNNHNNNMASSLPYPSSSSSSSSVSARVATEFDDCLLLHHAPRGDHNLASKHVQQLHTVFNALRYIIGEQSSDATLKQDHFSNWSFHKLLNRVRVGACSFLCMQFREDKMRREIEMRPVEARRGGIPGIRSDVRAFLNLIFDRGVPEQFVANNAPVLEGVPLWPLVYYCLRAGFTEEALNVVNDAVRNGCRQSSVLVFAECLAAFIASAENVMNNDSGNGSGGNDIHKKNKDKHGYDRDRRNHVEKSYCLPNDMLEKLIQEYGVNVKRGNDPYQRVCYVVIARIDPSIGDKITLLDSDYSLLFYSIEDYLWLRLSVARNFSGYRKKIRSHVPVQQQEQEQQRASSSAWKEECKQMVNDDDNVQDEALPESISNYELSMETVGNEMISLGAAHFNTHGDSPTLYALVLVLTGRFQEGITYLEDKARAMTEATHLAFILYYYGIIGDNGKSKPISSSSSIDGASFLNHHDTRNDEQETALTRVSRDGAREREDSNENRNRFGNEEMMVDYAGLMWRYASKLGHSDAGVAAVYIFTIDDAFMRKELLKKLIVQCKGHYESLVGRSSHGDGGILGELWNKKKMRNSNDGEKKVKADGIDEDDWRIVIVEGGEECEKLGDREKALKLYKIAGVKNKMMDIHLNRVTYEISNIHHSSSSNLSIRSFIIDEARQYVSDVGGVSEKSFNSLKVLLDIVEFYDLKVKAEYEQALNVLQRTRLLPKEDNEIVSKMSQLAYASPVWTEHVIERVPEVIVSCMEVVGAVYNNKSNAIVLSEEERIRLRKWATTLVNLSGMMRNLSADMSARLVSLEVIMN